MPCFAPHYGFLPGSESVWAFHPLAFGSCPGCTEVLPSGESSGLTRSVPGPASRSSLVTATWTSLRKEDYRLRFILGVAFRCREHYPCLVQMSTGFVEVLQPILGTPASVTVSRTTHVTGDVIELTSHVPQAHADVMPDLVRPLVAMTGIAPEEPASTPCAAVGDPAVNPQVRPPTVVQMPGMPSNPEKAGHASLRRPAADGE